MDDAPIEAPTADEPTKESILLGYIDAALAPAVQHTQVIGTASLSDLGVIVRAFRQALSHIVYGVPAEPIEAPVPFDALAAQKQEALDLQRAEQAADAKKAADTKAALLAALDKPTTGAEADEATAPQIAEAADEDPLPELALDPLA